MAVVIGIDPGSRFCGYGLVDIQGDHLNHLTHGVIVIPEHLRFAEKLHYLAQNLTALYKQYSPAQTVVEKVFLGKNADSAFKLGHVRGVCLQLAVEAGSEIFEYAARSVKKAVTGTGAATKEHVALVAKRMLSITEETAIDASDALALVLCHSQKMKVADIQRRLTEGVSL